MSEFMSEEIEYYELTEEVSEPVFKASNSEELAKAVEKFELENPDILFDRPYIVRATGRVIEPEAFMDNSDIRFVLLDSNVEVVSNYAFSGCDCMERLEIPNSVKIIGESAFEYCKWLEEIEIPSSVEEIGHCAFLGCESLMYIKVACDNTVYDSRNNCNALIETATNRLLLTSRRTLIPDTVQEISDYAFYNKRNLKSIKIPASVRRIGNSAFADCSDLESIVVEEGNPVYDSRNNCNAIIETATNTLLLASNNTWIPNTIQEIGDHAYDNYSELTSLKIPASVRRIGKEAFSNRCLEFLESIVVEEGNPVYDSRNGCNAIIETATNTLLWGCNDTVIPDTVEEIANAAFYHCRELKNIVIPASVRKIARNAFFGCIHLDSIVVEEGNPVYDSRNNCNAIIETAKNTLLLGCNSTEIPDTVVEIANDAFHCQELKSIVIPDSVRKIGRNSFWAFDNLEEIHISDPKLIEEAFLPGVKVIQT